MTTGQGWPAMTRVQPCFEGSGMQRRHRPTEKPVQCSEQKRGTAGTEGNGQDLQDRKSGGDRERQEELVHISDGPY